MKKSNISSSSNHSNQNNNQFKISDHLKQAWDLGISGLWPFVLIRISTMAASLIVSLIFIVVVGVLFYLQPESSQVIEALKSDNYPLLMDSLKSMSFVFKMMLPIFLAAGVVSSLINSWVVGSTIALFDPNFEGERKFKPAAGIGMTGAVSLFLFSWINFFLGLGSMMVFIFPALIIGWMIAFTTFGIIYDQLRVMDAVHYSMNMVKDNFSFVFGRFVVFIVLVMVTVLLNAALFKDYAGLTNIILQSVISLVSVPYLAIMYRYLQGQSYSKKNMTPVAWTWIVAVIGWLLIGGLVVMGARFWKQNKSDITKSIEMANHLRKQGSLDKDFDDEEGAINNINLNINNDGASKKASIRINDETVHLDTTDGSEVLDFIDLEEQLSDGELSQEEMDDFIKNVKLNVDKLNQ